MKSDMKLTIPKELINDLEKYGNSIAKNIALETKKLITEECAYAVEQFYNSYNPTYYARKWELYNSFKPYYRNPHGTRYHGGVEISSAWMHDVHEVDNDYILSNSLAGYHGSQNLGIYTPPWIYDHVVGYRDNLFAFIGHVANDAIKDAQKEHYNILRF